MADVWVEAANTGKGFITAQDWVLLVFRAYPANIWRVSGDISDIAAWGTRVGGTQLTPAEAQAKVDGWNANIYEFTEFWIEKLSSNAASQLMNLALGDPAVRAILSHWLSESIDVRTQLYKDDLAYLLASGHIQQAKHDEMLLNKDGV